MMGLAVGSFLIDPEGDLHRVADSIAAWAERWEYRRMLKEPDKWEPLGVIIEVVILQMQTARRASARRSGHSEANS